MTESAEVRLVRSIRSGDESALTELYNVYSGTVRNIIRRFLSNPADVEDATQDVFIKVFAGIPAFKGDSKLGTWIHTIAVRHCLDIIRARRLESAFNTLTPDGVKTSFENVKSNQLDPESTTMNSELALELNRAFAALPAKWRVTTQLWADGFTETEIAANTGRSVPVLRGYVNRGKKKLRSMLLLFKEKGESI